MGMKILPVFGREKEEKTLDFIKQFSEKLEEIDNVFRDCVKSWLDDDYEKLAHYSENIFKIEDDADTIIHKITLKMYSGAFLPNTRGHLHDFADRLDDIIDEVQNSAHLFQYTKDKKVKEEIKSAFWKLADETRRAIEKMIIILEDFLDNSENIMDHIKEAKQIEHNCDLFKKDILDLVYFGKKEAVTNTLLVNIANHVSGISDAVEAACQKIIVLKLLKQT